MKKLFLSLIAVFMFMPFMVVNASSASISVSASNTVMVGNNVTVTVTLSSSSKIGSWEADLSYDKTLLELTSSSAEGGGTYMVNVAQNGTTSKKYTFTFKAKKSGSAKVSVNSFSLYDYNTMELMKTSGGSKTISIKTKEEIEASYSDNANLKSLTVGSYLLTPEFSKSVKEYTVEVPNEVESVTIGATKEDGNASVSGAGEKELIEGNNKFEIVVTAQKGNSQTYVVNVYRKELNPIGVAIEGKDYTLIRKAENLPTYKTFIESTTTYDGVEVPSLYNQNTGMMLIGVKDDAGKVYTYIYNDNKITNIYVEIDNYAFSLLPLELKKSDIFKDYKIKTVNINGVNVEAYTQSGSKYVVIYAQNVESGEENYYSYFISDGSFQIYNEEVIGLYEKRLTNFKYVLCGLVGVIVLQFLILIIRKPKRNKKDKNLVDTIDKHITSEIEKDLINNKNEVKEVEKSNKKLEKELNIKIEDNDNEIKLVKDDKEWIYLFLFICIKTDYYHIKY